MSAFLDILSEPQLLASAKFLGAGLAVGLSAVGSAAGEGFAAGRAVQIASRQPAMSGTILRTMLIGQAIAETSGILGLVVAIIMVTRSTESLVNVAAAGSLLGAALSMGLAAISPGLGSGLVAGRALEAMGHTPAAAGKVTMTMLMAQALTESGAIFGFVVAMLLLFGRIETTAPQEAGYWPVMVAALGKYLGAGLSMGLATMGAGLGIGYAGSRAVQAIGRNIEQAGPIQRTMFVGAAVTESVAVYGLVVALLMILV